MKPIKNCPKCRAEEDGSVIDSRESALAVRRRRKCLSCGARWTTYEISAEDFEKIKGGAIGIEQIRNFLRSAAELPEDIRDAIFTNL